MSPSTCLGCGIPYSADSAPGWIDETRPTLGDGFIRYVACFRCRGLVPLPSESDPLRYLRSSDEVAAA